VVVAGSSRGAVDDFLREAAREGRGRFAVRRATLYQLGHELAAPRLAESHLVPVSGLGCEALATRSAFAAARERELVYFEPVATLPGFPRALRATLAELRLAAVPSSAVAQGGAGGGDLSLLLQRYEAELERWGLADIAEVLELGIEAVRAGALGASLPLLLLDLRLGSVLEQRLVAALSEWSTGVFATAAVGDDDTVRALEEVLGTGAASLDDDRGEPPSRLERVQRYVFLQEIPGAGAAGERPDRSVDFFSAPGEGQECVEIARRARDLAAAGVPFDRMAILLRHPRAYLPLLEDALRRAQLPAYFTRGTARPDPAGRAFLALLACAAEDVSASRFAEYLSLGEVPLLDAAGAPPVREVPWVEPEDDQLVFKSLEAPAEETVAEEADLGTPAAGGSLAAPAHWERLLVDAAVVGGGERWRRRLRGLEAELELHLREVDDEEPNRRPHLERQLERLRHLERFALPLVERLVGLPSAARWGEWLGALERLAAQALRHPETVLALLAELRPMEDVGPVDLDHVRSVLHERLVFLRFEPPRRRYGMLFVATIEEALGRSFDVVFVPGLAEGIFPRSAFEDPLLLDEMRAAVSSALEQHEDRLLEERFLLRLAVGAAEHRLVLSYPSLDLAVGRSRVPSFYALDLVRAAEGRLPDLRELSQRAAFGPGPRLGWPAPDRCEDAIDEAEFDLALLQPLLRGGDGGEGGDEAVRGRGRFLLECNEHLARSLRARWWRWSSRFTPHDGLVLDPGDEAWGRTQAALADQRLRRRSYSPTALQHFAACPYRFFLQAIQRLRPREEIVTLERIDPLTRGSLFHETQFALFGALRERGLLPLDSARLVEILDLTDRILDETSARYAERLAPAIPRVWHDEIESLRTDLRGWIIQVLEGPARWQPIHAELAFGIEAGEERDPASWSRPAEVLDGVLLRGSIDLVEEDSGGRRARVTDHKTGRAIRDPVRTVGGGRVLQPVLYALAAEQLLRERGLEVESGRLFFCTQRGGYATVEVTLDERSRSAAATVLETVDRGIAESFLPAAPDTGDCRYCDYRAICGPYEEYRVKRKRQDRLRDLVELRSLR
jgi:CRISPR/Cas system-associated exonuclease Cas4 (RecB family)